MAGLVVTTFLLTACVGSFPLTNHVLTWNRSKQRNKHVNELIFLGMIACGAYEAMVFVDIVFFNTREFWTGKVRSFSRVDRSGDVVADQEYSRDADGAHAVIRFSSSGRLVETLTVDQADPGAPLAISVEDAGGRTRHVLATEDRDGITLNIRDADGRVSVRRYGPDDLEALAASASLGNLVAANR